MNGWEKAALALSVAVAVVAGSAAAAFACCDQQVCAPGCACPQPGTGCTQVGNACQHCSRKSCCDFFGNCHCYICCSTKTNYSCPGGSCWMLNLNKETLCATLCTDAHCACDFADNCVDGGC